MAALVLFGGGGDLAMRMLLPSLYFLEHDGLLPDGLKIIGAARSEESRDEYIARVRQSVEAKAKADDAWSPDAWDRMAARLDYLAVDATSAESLKPLKDRVGEEGVETALAGAAGPDSELASEAADLIYHLLVLLRARHMVFQDVLDVLAQRAEAARQTPGQAVT